MLDGRTGQSCLSGQITQAIRFYANIQTFTQSNKSTMTNKINFHPKVYSQIYKFEKLQFSSLIDEILNNSETADKQTKIFIDSS